MYSDNGWLGAVQEISDPVASNRTSRSAKKHRPNPLFTTPLSALPVDITARIPSELHDYIIGQLNNDRVALCVCSLVCTAWLISSRYHLFQTAATIRVNRHNFRQFCDLLWTQRLNPYIGRLHLKSHNIDDNFEPGGPDFGGPTFQFNDDLQRLMGLPRIKSVRLEYHHDFKHAPLFSALAENFTGITELELVSMRCESFVHLLELLPLLRRVAVVHSAAHPSGDFDSDWDTDPDEIVLSNTPHDRIVDLAVYSVRPMTQILRWLPSQASIRRLAIRWIQVAHVGLFFDALRVLGTSLEHLVIGEAPTDPLLDLSYNTALHTFELTGIRCDVSSGNPDYFGWIPALLGQLRSRVLKRIVFVVDLPTRPAIEQLPWQRIAEVLANISVQRAPLEVEFSVSSHKRWATKAIDDKLCGCTYGLRVGSWERRLEYSLAMFNRR